MNVGVRSVGGASAMGLVEHRQRVVLHLFGKDIQCQLEVAPLLDGEVAGEQADPTVRADVDRHRGAAGIARHREGERQPLRADAVVEIRSVISGGAR